MLANIVTKLGAPGYIVTHGFGFINVNVIFNAAPVRLSFTLEGTPIIVPGTGVVATPIRLDFRLSATTIILPPVIVNGGPIRLDFKIQATPQVKNPVVVNAGPIRLNFTLDADTIIVPGNKIFASPIRLNFQIRGAALGTDIFILDFNANCALKRTLKAIINTRLTFLTPVELEEEVMKIRIT